MNKKRFTIAVDFDGVIHSYTTPWKASHIIPDPPVDGAIEWLLQMVAKFDVVIFSTRCKGWRGRWAMKLWLREHSGMCWYESPAGPGIEDVKFSYAKPPALVYIDDRAVRFEGTFLTAEQIHRLHPWKRKSSPKGLVPCTHRDVKIDDYGNGTCDTCGASLAYDVRSRNWLSPHIVA